MRVEVDPTLYLFDNLNVAPSRYLPSVAGYAGSSVDYVCTADRLAR
jgi:hypothetical protein